MYIDSTIMDCKKLTPIPDSHELNTWPWLMAICVAGAWGFLLVSFSNMSCQQTNKCWAHSTLLLATPGAGKEYSVVSVLRIQIRSNQKLFWDESLQKGPDPNRNCIFRHERRRFFFVSDFCIVYVFSKMCFVQSIPRTILWKKSVSIRLLFQQLVYSYSLNWKWTRDVMKCPFENYFTLKMEKALKNLIVDT